MTLRAMLAAGLFALTGAASNAQTTQRQPAAFPHDSHARMFPLCATCHAGVTTAGASPWPDPARCAACHDGVVEPRVSWQPRAGPRPGNVRFTHDGHARAVAARNPADTSLAASCSSCHNVPGAPRMTIVAVDVPRCLECHGARGEHFDVAPSACETCHVPLTQAPSLTREQIAAFPVPTSHSAADFVLGGHGRIAAAEAGDGRAIPASCSTCHSRELCTACHVNAPELRPVQSLMPDARAPAYDARPIVPASHRDVAFLRKHGTASRAAGASCANCHAREGCTTCHVGGAPPRAVQRLMESGPGRALGAHVVRTPPTSHTPGFRENHASEADARPVACETCHTRSSCLECHRPGNAQPASYHPRSFVTRHATAAWARLATCSDCHNTAQFCQSCHGASGVVASGRLGNGGYHDAFRGFSLGHGQAARQSLETCVACHAERDCAACHATARRGGFGFSPHGPGFNAARARAKNPTTCTACH